jgi:peptidoglycan/LPS O-acetylase OafA/YrhL
MFLNDLPFRKQWFARCCCIGCSYNRAQPQYLPGGFLGVDVFLLVSKFLITDILTSQQATRKFNLFGFLSRRAL